MNVRAIIGLAISAALFLTAAPVLAQSSSQDAANGKKSEAPKIELRPGASKISVYMLDRYDASLPDAPLAEYIHKGKIKIDKSVFPDDVYSMIKGNPVAIVYKFIFVAPTSGHYVFTGSFNNANGCCDNRQSVMQIAVNTPSGEVVVFDNSWNLRHGRKNVATPATLELVGDGIYEMKVVFRVSGSGMYGKVLLRKPNDQLPKELTAQDCHLAVAKRRVASSDSSAGGSNKKVIKLAPTRKMPN